MAERELCKVSLQIIAAHGAISCDNKERLILRPAKALDGTFVPGNAPDLLSSEAVNVYGWLRCSSWLVSQEFGVVAP